MGTIRIVGAGAGTGKTERLASEVLHAVSSGKARPSGIIMTTFTRKAASELLSRVSRTLFDHGKNEEAHQIRLSMIGTVNSVCGQLLGRFAYEAGLPVDQRIVPENEEQHIFNSVLSSVVTDRVTRNLHQLEERMSIGVSTPNNSGKEYSWRSTVLDLIKKSRTNLIHPDRLAHWADESCRFAFSRIPAVDGSLDGMHRELYRTTNEVKAVIEDGRDAQQNSINALKLLTQYSNIIRNGRSLTWQQIGQMAKLTAGKRQHDTDSLLHNLRHQAAAHHTWPEFRNDIEEYIRLVFEIAAKVLNHYQEYKKKNRLVDFVDQEALTLALMDRKEVCDRIAESYDMLLVDEFQDTSPIQLALFLRLADIIPVSVWVGDPKQAIYGFRGTDPELMIETVKALEAGGVGIKTDNLSKSYRSVKPIVDFVNQCFVPIFETQKMTANEIALSASRTGKPHGASIASWVIQKDGRSHNKPNDINSIATQCFEMLSNASSCLVEPKGGETRPVKPGDIAILARSNADCDALAHALRIRNIPVNRPGPGLCRTAEVLFIISSLRLIDNPQDTLAAAQITWISDVLSGLNSPDEWLNSRLIENKKQQQSESKEKNRSRAWATHEMIRKIDESRESLIGLTPIEIVLKVIDVSSIKSIVQRSDDPRSAGANIDRLEALCRAYEETSIIGNQAVTLAGLLQYLSNLEDSNEDFAAITDADAITVSTWHKAKGLEWPVVLLYGLDSAPWVSLYTVEAYSTDKIDIKNPLASRGIRFLPNPYGSSSGPFNELLEQTDEYTSALQNAWRERVRVLYVLFTRARDRLIFATRDKQPAGLDTPFGSVCTVPFDSKPHPTGWKIESISTSDRRIERTDESEWYRYSTTETSYPDAVYHPSELVEEKPTGYSAGEVETIGERIKISGSVDMAETGAILHRYLAVDTEGLSENRKKVIAERLIAASGLTGKIDIEELIRNGNDIIQWVHKMWNDATLHREWPLSMVFDDGKTIEGIADLVVEMKDSFVVVDYKTFPGTIDKVQTKAISYGPQLSAYSEVLEQALGKKCAGCFICFAVGGCAVEVNVSQDVKSAIIN